MSTTPAATRWAAIIDRQEASGLSVRCFAQQNGINPSTLSWWRSKLNRTRPQLVEFAEVHLAPEPAAPILLRLPARGLQLHVDHDTDLRLLRRLLDALA